MLPLGHECLRTIRCDCSTWLQSPTPFIHYFVHCIPCCMCTVPHQGHHELDVSLVLSLDLKTAHLQSECVDLSGVPLLSLAFSEALPLHLKPHSLHFHVNTCGSHQPLDSSFLSLCDPCLLEGDHYSTGASFILSDFREQTWDLSYFILREGRTF